MNREQRLELIRAIEQNRDSRVITYLTSDRQGAAAQIGSDAVRAMYHHVRVLGFEGVPRVDLFLFSQGGGVDVPCRMVTMLREYCEELNVLVPYKAHSAATLIALGAEHVVMGKKGELGPIDPILTRTEQAEQTVVRENISVEDVMAFIAFLKERAGLGDQSAISDNVSILIEKLTPWVIGSIYRIHSHIRSVARRLLTLNTALEERQIDSIVEALAEKTYSHGHAIGRAEAREIGLPIGDLSEKLDDQMWKLFEAYESLMKLDQPIDPQGIIPAGSDEYEEPAILACIESGTRLDVCRGTLRFSRVRQMPPQLSLNLSFNVPLPPGISAQQLPAQTQQMIQALVKQLHGQIPAMVEAEIRKQAPVKGTKGALLNASWQEATNEGI